MGRLCNTCSIHPTGRFDPLTAVKSWDAGLSCQKTGTDVNPTCRAFCQRDDVTFEKIAKTLANWQINRTKRNKTKQKTIKNTQKQTDRQTDRQKGRQTERQTDRWTDKQTNKIHSTLLDGNTCDLQCKALERLFVDPPPRAVAHVVQGQHWVVCPSLHDDHPGMEITWLWMGTNLSSSGVH